MPYRKKLFAALPLSVAFSITCACGPVADTRILNLSDTHPPVLLGVETRDSGTLILHFDKSTEIITMDIVPGLALSESVCQETDIVLSFSDSQAPGQEYSLEASVRDEKRNSMDFLTSFYGFNPDIPSLLINEFTTQGSGNHPDLVELFVLSRGNLAGVAFYQGTKTVWEDRFVFPGLIVSPGDYILLHCKPQGLPEELNEVSVRDSSGGLDASASAWDFWLDGGTGLSGNNGVLSVYANPYGAIIDAVLYSNRTSASDEDYRGFGSADTMEKADELAETGAWTASGDLAAPEDAVNPEDSTSTRSVCRNSLSGDTDGKEDWHIVPTGRYSFGRQNSDEVYAAQ
ncbi:MAG: hypothetical protein E4H36_03950 [Spirochaetales bacterium]|nr:MAG: hypothetical protein E4H36_03950 [Spirochaetales bacterium]